VGCDYGSYERFREDSDFYVGDDDYGKNGDDFDETNYNVDGYGDGVGAGISSCASQNARSSQGNFKHSLACWNLA